MILQCDQCQTKFRLDDSKMKPGGVKVRCSKCRHVFLAGAEPKQEESDFDAILSGLGAPAPEKKEEPAPASEQGMGFSFEEEPAQGSAAPKAPAAEAPAAPGPAAEAAAAFSFEEEPEKPAAAAKAPAAEAAAPPVEESDFPDFSSFGFPAESAAPKEEPPAQEPAGFGEFDFNFEEPPAAPKEAEPKAASGFEFGEFTFDEEPPAPPAAKEESAEGGPALGDNFDFGDFSFESEPAAKPEEGGAPAAGTDLAFGEFEFSAEPTVKREEAAAPDLDFGEFTFNEEPAPQAAEPAVGKEFDFGDFTFEEEPPPIKEPVAAEAPDELASFTQEAPAPQPHEEFAPADFSFDEEFGEELGQKPAQPVAPVAPAPEEDFSLGDFSFAEEDMRQKEKPAAPTGEFPLSDFSFGEGFAEEEPAKEPAAAAPEKEVSADKAGMAAVGILGAAAGAAAAGAAAAGAGRGSGETGGFMPPPITPSSAGATQTGKGPLDFDFGEPVPTKAEGYEEEELPPLSISSRRKGRSVVTMALIAIAVLFTVAVCGAGLYLLQKGPAAMQTFDRMGLGFVGKWFGMEAPEEGRITVRNPQASFYQNKEAGELFVVTGEAVNSYRKPRASIHVKVNIYDKKGAVLMQKTAYCGNRLSKEQLETLPMAKIESIMTNQFGDSLANLGVKPGQAIGFVVAIPNVPKDAADFGVEVVGSTVAGDGK